MDYENMHVTLPEVLPDMLTRKQVAAYLQISLSNLDTYISREDLPRLKFGGTVRYLKTDVEDFLTRYRKWGRKNEQDVPE